MYEQPSLHMELARLRHKDFEAKAQRARLAAQASSGSRDRLELVKSAVLAARSLLSRRPRPVVVVEPRLQPTG